MFFKRYFIKDSKISHKNILLCFSLFTVHCSLFTLLIGCATEYNVATQSEEFIYYDTDKEIKIGSSVAREIEKKYKISGNSSLEDRVKTIGAKIAAVCDRK